MNNVRKVTNKLLGLVEEGVIPAELLLKSCLGYMSERDVEDMALSEGYLDDEEDDGED